MATNGYRFIGVGLYTVPESSRLTHVSPGRIRRWMRGYVFRTGSGSHKSPPVITSSLPPLDGGLTLTFLDLQEIRFVDAFLEAGVLWKTLRAARENAQAALGSYPFSRGRFVTDGRAIFEDLARRSARSDAAFVNMVTHQASFRGAVLPYLAKLRFGRDGQATE